MNYKINVNVVHCSRYHDQPDLNGTDHPAQSSHLEQFLEHWLASNFSEAHDTLLKRLYILASPLEQVIHNCD
jgi:hypothetical protein